MKFNKFTPTHLYAHGEKITYFALQLATWRGCFRNGKGLRRGSRIQRGGFVQEFRLENRSYPDVHDFSLRMQVIIAND